MSDTFFVVTAEMRDAANRIAQARDRLTTQVTAFHSGPAARTRTDAALPAADVKADFGTNLDEVNGILDKLTTALGAWSTAFTTAAEHYQNADAVAAGTIDNSMPVSGTIGGEPVTFTPMSADVPADGSGWAS